MPHKGKTLTLDWKSNTDNADNKSLAGSYHNNEGAVDELAQNLGKTKIVTMAHMPESDEKYITALKYVQFSKGVPPIPNFADYLSSCRTSDDGLAKKRSVTMKQIIPMASDAANVSHMFSIVYIYISVCF